MKINWIRLALWSFAAVLLIVLLLRQFDTSLADAALRLVGAPWWMWGSVIFLNCVMTAIGAVKWRIVRDWVSPGSTPIDLTTLGTVTAAGSFASFFLPPQPAHLLVRWWAFRREDAAAAGVLGSTFFEQVYDLIVYLGAAVLAVLLLWLDLDGAVLAGAICVGLSLILVAAPIPLAIFIRIAVVLGRDSMPAKLRDFMRSAETTFRSAEQAPVRRLMMFSVTLLVCRVLTVLAIALAISPDLNLLLVAAGVPAVALLSVLPITPAGLGVAEWSWGALLVAAGASLPDAAIAALGFRLVNAVALLVILAVLTVLRRAQN